MTATLEDKVAESGDVLVSQYVYWAKPEMVTSLMELLDCYRDMIKGLLGSPRADSMRKYSDEVKQNVALSLETPPPEFERAKERLRETETVVEAILDSWRSFQPERFSQGAEEYETAVQTDRSNPHITPAAAYYVKHQRDVHFQLEKILRAFGGFYTILEEVPHAREAWLTKSFLDQRERLLHDMNTTYFDHSMTQRVERVTRIKDRIDSTITALSGYTFFVEQQRIPEIKQFWDRTIRKLKEDEQKMVGLNTPEERQRFTDLIIKGDTREVMKHIAYLDSDIPALDTFLQHLGVWLEGWDAYFTTVWQEHNRNDRLQAIDQRVRDSINSMLQENGEFHDGMFGALRHLSEEFDAGHVGIYLSDGRRLEPKWTYTKAATLQKLELPSTERLAKDISTALSEDLGQLIHYTMTLIAEKDKVEDKKKLVGVKRDSPEWRLNTWSQASGNVIAVPMFIDHNLYGYLIMAHGEQPFDRPTLELGENADTYVLSRIGSRLDTICEIYRKVVETDWVEKGMKQKALPEVVLEWKPFFVKAKLEDVCIAYGDLTGSTDLAARHSENPQETIDIMDLYLEKMGETAKRHRGTILKGQGDGSIFMYQKKDAKEAVLATIETLKRFHWMNTERREHGEDYVGMHAGIALASATIGVIGPLKEFDAWGDAPNMGRRLEAEAKGRGDILINGTLYDTVKDIINAEPVNEGKPIEMKGLGPQPVYKVLSVKDTRDNTPGVERESPLYDRFDSYMQEAADQEGAFRRIRGATDEFRVSDFESRFLYHSGHSARVAMYALAIYDAIKQEAKDDRLMPKDFGDNESAMESLRETLADDTNRRALLQAAILHNVAKYEKFKDPNTKVIVHDYARHAGKRVRVEIYVDKDGKDRCIEVEQASDSERYREYFVGEGVAQEDIPRASITADGKDDGPLTPKQDYLFTTQYHVDPEDNVSLQIQYSNCANFLDLWVKKTGRYESDDPRKLYGRTADIVGSLTDASEGEGPIHASYEDVENKSTQILGTILFLAREYDNLTRDTPHRPAHDPKTAFEHIIDMNYELANSYSKAIYSAMKKAIMPGQK